LARNETTDQGPRAAVKAWTGKAVEHGEVAEPGPALLGMSEDLLRIGTLLKGTSAMRLASRKYLVQHPYESNDAYEKRLEVNYLDNFTLRTLNTLVGKAFKDIPQPGADMPDEVLNLLDDVDDCGTALVPFAREWFRLGLEQAVSHVLIDMPAPAPIPEGRTRNMADDLRDGMRPVWRMISAEDMLDIQETKINGKRQVSLIRFRDDEIRPVGQFGHELVQRVKVLRNDGGLVTWEAWELQTEGKNKKVKWVLAEGPARFGLNTIPLVSFYTDKTGVGEGRSNLADLAHLNVRHWQSTADQTNILTVVRFPILAASGVRESDGEGESGQIVVGPNKFLTTPDPQSKVYYVEHTGAAVDAGKGELERLESAMASYGAQFLEKGSGGPETASGRIIDEAAAISPLKSWGLNFKDALETACWYTAQWLKLGEEIDTPIEFEVEDDVNMADPTEVQSLDKARERKDISRETWLNEAVLRGIIKHEDFDADADQELLDDEAPPPSGGLDGMAKALGEVVPPKI
jgi:hypothetical protein